MHIPIRKRIHYLKILAVILSEKIFPDLEFVQVLNSQFPLSLLLSKDDTVWNNKSKQRM